MYRRVPSRCEVVLFDLDGTLVDTVALILASFRHATNEVLGQALPDDVLMRDVGMPLALQMASFNPERADELVRAYREHNASVHDEMIREYPGTAESLDRLCDAGKRLGVVTSKSRPVAMRALDLFGMTGRFEVVVASEDVNRHKPDPYPLEYAAERMGVCVRETVYVGDSPHDVNAANSAGALSMAALWGAFEADVIMAAKPAYAVQHITEAADLLTGCREG